MRVLLFTGGGGAGVTTTATATAARLAQRGVKTLLLRTDPSGSGPGSAGGQPLEVSPGLWTSGAGGAHPAFTELFAALHGGWPDDALVLPPGSTDVLTLLTLRDRVRSGNWDVVVVDCPPIARMLALIGVPEATSWYMQRIPPFGRPGRGSGVPLALAAALAQLREELDATRRMLTDTPTSSVCLVVTPGPACLEQVRLAHAVLGLHGYPLDLVVANRVFPRSRAALVQAWARPQQVALAQLRSVLGVVPVREVPYLGEQPEDPRGWSTVADFVYRAPDGGQLDPMATAAHPVRPPQVCPISGGYAFVVPLPHAGQLARTGVLEAVRVDDELSVTVGGYRRVLTLPSVLRRCAVAGGTVAADAVRVRFRPDPALWPQDLALPHDQPDARPGGTSQP